MSSPLSPLSQAPYHMPPVYRFAGAQTHTHTHTHTSQGESEPTPFFYQNLGEAEFLVALFMFMRLLGYPAHKITMLTTYNGQKALLRDVVEKRCAQNPLFGRPHKVGG